MGEKPVKVALICGENCDGETFALRSTLEYFGAQVMTYWIGRPNDLIAVLNGENLYDDVSYIVLCFHGDEGELIMQELGDEVYEPGEPQGNFSSKEILKYGDFAGKKVIGNGCTLGDPALAHAFIEKGASWYIGPDDYPYGNSALLFAIHFFYEVLENEQSDKEAFEQAIKIDPEKMEMYKWYSNEKCIEW
ncbi:delta-aminolevulinic acid dehydratase [Brevibacillus daliensis]|uniref:delta-aminolevulinic acid dehydratase n=1 Tax=Brevibacillus daliensis TaxID=2892995 RepID=UPI001E471042|nr:delta-aminolevulinic acid dehydratase [Brevibacillus daliensis]